MEESTQETESNRGLTQESGSEIRHHEEHEAMLRDAAFFQQHEKKLLKSNNSTGNNQADHQRSLLPLLLITRFTELKLKASVEQYEHYIYQKYGLSSLFQLTDKQVREQRNVLQKCERDPQVKAQFETFLESGLIVDRRS